MTDFVIEQINEVMLDGTGTFCDRVGNYAKFLKQPLTLGMFIPCDEDGNVLEKPHEEWELSYWDFSTKQGKYLKAKERVLFEGAVVNASLGFNVEHLVGQDINLTQSAIKQLGL